MTIWKFAFSKELCTLPDHKYKTNLCYQKTKHLLFIFSLIIVTTIITIYLYACLHQNCMPIIIKLKVKTIEQETRSLWCSTNENKITQKPNIKQIKAAIWLYIDSINVTNSLQTTNILMTKLFFFKIRLQIILSVSTVVYLE